MMLIFLNSLRGFSLEPLGEQKPRLWVGWERHFLVAALRYQQRGEALSGFQRGLAALAACTGAAPSLAACRHW